MILSEIPIQIHSSDGFTWQRVNGNIQWHSISNLIKVHWEQMQTEVYIEWKTLLIL